MQRKSETENNHQPKYISSFAQSFYEQEVREANEISSNENSTSEGNRNHKYNQKNNTKDETGVNACQQIEPEKLSIKNLNSQERKILKRVEQKIGRSLNALEKIDAIEHILYEPDRTIAWLEEEGEDDKEKLAASKTETELNFAAESVVAEIESLNSFAKMIEAIKKAFFYLPIRKENKLKALLSSKILAGATGLLCILTVSQFLIASKLANLHLVLTLVSLLIGAFIILRVLSTYKDLIGFANVVNASTENDIDISGKHLAAFFTALEIHLVLYLFIKSDRHL